MNINIKGGRLPFSEVNNILEIIKSYGYDIAKEESGIVCTPKPGEPPKVGRQLPLPLFAEMPSPKATQGVRS